MICLLLFIRFINIVKALNERLKLTLLIVFVLEFNSTYAQVSLVPVDHPVYDLLHYYRIRGIVTNYEYESLPYDRSEIKGFLYQIDREPGGLSSKEKMTISTYLNEFDQSRTKREYIKAFGEDSPFNGVYFHKYLSLTGTEPHFISYTNQDSTISTVFDWQIMGRTRTLVDDSGREKDLTGFLSYSGYRIYSTINDLVGIHLERTNTQAAGDFQVLQYLPYYADTYFNFRGPDGKDVSYKFDAFTSIKKGKIRATIGRGNLKIGPGLTDPLLMRKEAPPFNWIKFDISGKYVRYTAIHGSLYSTFRRDQTLEGTVGGQPIVSRVAYERWLAIHRATFFPAKWLQFSITELLTYSNRGRDYAYLNPITPLFWSELENGDRDNAMIALDGRLSPVRGLEFYATIFIDDLVDVSSIIKDEGQPDDDVAINLGGYLALPKGWRLAGGYTRIEPFVYTHFQVLNAYEQRGRSMGHQLGPNADELVVNLRKYLKGRAWADVSYVWARKGLNPIDEDGNPINAGGDILWGNAGLAYQMFRESDLNSWQELRFQGQIEPFRGLQGILNIRMRMPQQGERISDLTLVDMRVQYGF